MLEKNSFERYSAIFVKKLTRRTPLLYSFLKKCYHEYVFMYEKLRLQRKYNIIHVRYNEDTLKMIRNIGFRSQFGQDYFLVKNGLVPRENGSFVDIGCNHPVIGCNSYYFEKMCSYKGVAIDPVTIYDDEWLKGRPNTIHINAFVSNSNYEIDFAEVDGPGGWESKLSGTADKVNIGRENITLKIRKVQPSKLQDILDTTFFSFNIDILFVDVEGHELEVLSSAHWSNQKPKVIVIENIGFWKNQEILRSFIINKGYKFFARIWIDDIFVRT